MRLYLATIALMFLAGCGALNSELIYEGVRSQQKANNAGMEPKQPVLPSYQQYEIERNRLKN